MSKKKRFRKHEKEQIYRVANYSLDTVEIELDKALSPFTNLINSLLGLDQKGLSNESKALLANTVKALHAYYQLHFLPFRTKIRVERIMDLKMHAGVFPWHRPISDPYIRKQFYLASKECFEMELEVLRSMVDEFVGTKKEIIVRVSNMIKARG